MEKDIATQKRVFGHRLKDALRRRRIWKEGGHYEWSPYPGMEEAAAFINNTDVMRAVIITDETRALMAEIAELGGEPVDAVKVMADAFTNELKKEIALLRTRGHVPVKKKEHEPISVISARHLVNPELGDEWGAFGKQGRIVIVKLISVDEFIVWVSGHPTIRSAFYRIDRKTLSLWVYSDLATASTLTDFKSHLWMAGCTPIDTNSSLYHDIIASQEHPYTEAVNLLK